MLGYDVRLYQLVAFVIGSVLAGLSGVLYTAWGQFITPSSMGLTAAALPIIWVAVGGRKDITADAGRHRPADVAFQQLTVKGSQYALILMGVILLVVVLFAPEGLFVTVWKKLRARGRTRPAGTAPKPSPPRRPERPWLDPADARAQEVLRRPVRDQRRRPRDRARRAALPDRAERRRQEHAVQADPGLLSAVRGHDPVQRRRCHRAAAARAGAARA